MMHSEPSPWSVGVQASYRTDNAKTLLMCIILMRGRPHMHAIRQPFTCMNCESTLYIWGLNISDT